MAGVQGWWLPAGLWAWVLGVVTNGGGACVAAPPSGRWFGASTLLTSRPVLALGFVPSHADGSAVVARPVVGVEVMCCELA